MVRREFVRLLGLAGLASILTNWRVVLAAALSAPVLSASVSGSTVTLNWTDAGDEISYRVWRGTSQTSLSQIASLPANVLTYQDTP